jgi:glycosyltransferase involved in cell wall biosynthesis
MVVLQINKFFWPKGGAERYFFMVSEELERRGHQVVHFSMDHPENLPSPYAKYFVSRVDYDSPGGALQTLKQASSFIRSGEAARKIRALVRDHKPDVAHLHNIYHQLTPSIIAALRESGVPAVMTLHDYKLICPNYDHFAGGEYCYRCRGAKYFHAVFSQCGGSFARSALLSVEAYWQQISGVYGRVSRFIAPSRFMRDRVAAEARATGVDAERVVFLPSFCPPEEAGEEPTADEAAVLDGLPDGYVLYFGRVSVEKGLDTLVDAAEGLPGVPFVVCGDGPRRAALEADASARSLGNVHFTGYVNKPLLERIVGRARAVVLPAIWPENAPFTVIEAAAAGVPLIVSDMGGLPEMADVVSGLVFRHGDCAELAARIDELWSDPAAAGERGAAGRKAAAEYYDRGRHMEALEKIYEEVTGG